jgi:HEAT repeat protein
VIAIRALERRAPTLEAQKALEAAGRSPFSIVRRHALRSLAEKYPEAAKAELLRALLDSNISVREEAQFHLNKEGTVNLRDFYLANVSTSNGETLAASLAGLGEAGRKEDTTLISQYLAAERSQVRSAALRAITKLDPAYDAAIFLAALCDKSARVGRAAALGLRKRVNSVGGPGLWTAYLRCKGSAKKRRVLFLIARLSKWESLGLLIQALGDPETGASEAAARYKMRLWQRWNRSFVPPTKSQAETLRVILETHKLLITNEEKQHWESYLRDS